MGTVCGRTLVDQADRLERAQRLVVEPDTTRVVDKAWPLIDDEGANTLQTKDVRQRQTDGTGTDDDDSQPR